ncbi:uncharacterized protein [Dermacentor andersoni]|uniref:uncharacterized protein n=1 Tax=Dermacentor andersoni TaxID=34620 RepID=UPI002415C9D7|nr:uncharacterized protein LOC129388099 [Dermacentor andersoni]
MAQPSATTATTSPSFLSDSMSSSNSSMDSSDFTSSSTSVKGAGTLSTAATITKRKTFRERSLKTPKLPEPPKTHEDLLHLTQMSSSAIIPTDYPILIAPPEDMRRLMGVPRLRRFTALEARRRMRNELGRLRASVSQMWFVCLLVLAALAVPAGLVIAPFITFGGLRPTTARPAGWTRPTTAYPWINVSRDCLRPVRLNDDIKQINIHNTTLQAVAAHRGDVLCLFNNSRFRKAHLYDYAPTSMPLSLCNSLLYWSLAVEDGVVRDRVPEFDVHYGVWKLRELVQGLARGGSLPPLLVGLGGHREDSAHFSRMGRDSILISKFAASLLRFSDKHGIGGAVIDWKDMGGACGHSDDFLYLSRVLAAVVRLRNLNADDYALGVIVPADTAVARAVTRVAAKATVSFVIYETHRLHLDDVVHMCSAARADAIALIADMQSVAAMAARVTPPVATPRLCVSFTAGLPVSRAYEASPPAPVLDSVPVGNVSLTPGVVAIYEFCALTSVAQVSSYAAPGHCTSITKRPVGHTAHDVTLPSGAVVTAGTAIDDYYAFVSPATIRAEFTATAAVDTRRCAAVYDLDFDLYRGGCVNVQPHFGIMNIQAGLR